MTRRILISQHLTAAAVATDYEKALLPFCFTAAGAGAVGASAAAAAAAAAAADMPITLSPSFFVCCKVTLTAAAATS